MAIASAVSCSGLIVDFGRFRLAGQEQSRPKGAPATITSTLQSPIELSSGQRFRGTVDCCSAGLARADQVRAACWNEEYRPHASHGKEFLVTDQRRGRTQIQPNLSSGCPHKLSVRF